MGTFLLENTKVSLKEKQFKTEIYFDDNGNQNKRKVFAGRETVNVKLEFVSNGNTSDFSEGEILILIMDKLKEIKKPTIIK